MKFENGSFFASGAELRALCAYASKDETREHLASVCFDAGKGRASATDCHRLIVLDAYAPGASGERDEFLVNARALSEAIKGMGKKKAIEVRVSKTGVNLACDAIHAALPTVAAVFPPIDQVIPARGKYQPAEQVGFNPLYLADLRVLGDIAQSQGMRAPSCKVRLGGELDPARVDSEFTEGSATIVVMPMRI